VSLTRNIKGHPRLAQLLELIRSIYSSFDKIFQDYIKIQYKYTANTKPAY
jgi:hypothetical protein